MHPAPCGCINCAFEGCKEGNTEKVELYLASGGSVNYMAPNGDTPLRIAAGEGQLEVVKMLIEKGALVDNGTVHTPLYAASFHGHSEVVKFLLEKGAPADPENIKQSSPLYVAVQNGHYEVVKLLLERGAHANKAVGSPVLHNSSTPLNIAVTRGHLGVVKLLLDGEVDKPVLSHLLFNASTYGQHSIAQILLEKGAHVDGSNTHFTPLYIACKNGHLELVKMFLDNGACINLLCGMYSPLMAAATPEIAAILLERGADVHLTNVFGTFPLHLAKCGRIASLILDHGADIDSLNNSGSSALHKAAQSGRLDVVQVLVERGANVELEHLHTTAVGLAAENNHLEVVKWLVLHGAKLKVDSCTAALRESLNKDLLPVSQVLIHNCEEITGLGEEVSDSEAPAIHSTVESDATSSLEVLKLLIGAGVNLNTVWKNDLTMEKKTAIHVAIHKKDANKVWQLVLHGADTSIPFVWGSATKTVWQLCEGDRQIHQALLHFWTPQTHKFHPRWIKDAIICVLLVAKKLKWPFDRLMMHKILSFVAYGWHDSAVKPRPKKKARTETSNM